jgi:protein-S-isoprenylcysteine O-methyltransferase Ste14
MGLILAGAGLALILWAALWFLRKRTPIEPHHAPKALIVEGPYRINRNPIYTGLVLMLLGWGLWLGALSALAPAAVFAAVVDRRFVRSEEAALRSVFGGEAERYFAATRRW